jgi:hypothetical protein
MHGRIDGGKATLFTRTGLDWSHRYQRTAEALLRLPRKAKKLDRPAASRRLSMIVAQQPAQSLTAPHRPLALPTRDLTPPKHLASGSHQFLGLTLFVEHKREGVCMEVTVAQKTNPDSRNKCYGACWGTSARWTSN